MSFAATLVYLLCLLTSAACFVMLALNNLFVVVDLVILPNFDLALPRSLSTLAGVSLLLYGFISELD